MDAIGPVVIWLSVPRYTVLVKASEGIIIEASPVVRKRWMGLELKAFVKWHERTYRDKCHWQQLRSQVIEGE